MRTTIDLPPDLHRITKALAHDQGHSLSEMVTILLRRALGQGGDVRVHEADGRTGLPSIRLGTTITSEDVRALDDEP